MDHYFNNSLFLTIKKIQILKDLAKALNFSYMINPPIDGFKWGGIDDNGKPFGLVADMRVGLVIELENNIFF